MFSLYFGHYLLNRGLITPDQLTDALDLTESVYLKLGVLAVNAGYMTASRVGKVHQMQTKVDRMFGELAIELGFLTKKQLDDLLSTQKQGHLLLGQALVDKDYLSLEQLQVALDEYKKAYGLSEGQIYKLQQGDVDEIVNTFVRIADSPEKALYTFYISLMLRNVIRFIDNSPRVESSQIPEKLNAEWLVWQEITGSVNLFTAIAAEEPVFMDLARRYSGQGLLEPDELAQASVAEFLNLHNGLFLVNMSNNGVELEMKPQLIGQNKTVTGLGTGCIVPVYLRSGRFDVIISDSNPAL
ncbi:MAG: hypothetical protein M0028_01275 [Clostridia bacterium]|nr:hypothetical protein [Clostridia bacterium]